LHFGVRFVGTSGEDAGETAAKINCDHALPGFTGDLDHFAVDLHGGRLFLASEDQKTVEVFDLRTGKRTHSVKGFGQPLTMAYLVDSDRLIVTDGGGTDAVELVDCKEYKIINTLKLGPGVDHGVYNPVDKSFYVENGGAQMRRPMCSALLTQFL